VPGHAAPPPVAQCVHPRHVVARIVVAGPVHGPRLAHRDRDVAVDADLQVRHPQVLLVRNRAAVPAGRRSTGNSAPAAAREGGSPAHASHRPVNVDRRWTPGRPLARWAEAGPEVDTGAIVRRRPTTVNPPSWPAASAWADAPAREGESRAIR